MGVLMLEDGLEDSLGGSIIETALDIFAEESAAPEENGAIMETGRGGVGRRGESRGGFTVCILMFGGQLESLPP